MKLYNLRLIAGCETTIIAKILHGEYEGDYKIEYNDNSDIYYQIRNFEISFFEAESKGVIIAYCMEV